MTQSTDVSLIPAAMAADHEFVGALTDLVNRVYAEAERGLWKDGASRTGPPEISALIEAGEIAVARRDGRLAGAVRIQRLDPDTAEFGMLVAAPELRGLGIGRDLVTFAEGSARARGARRMQLELLVPRDWAHPTKEFARDWYTRMGYRVVRTGRFDEDYPHLVARLATPCDFLIFLKDL